MSSSSSEVPACEPLQRTHLQRSLLRMSPTAGDETSRGRNPENGRRRDFGRRRHRQSGFQHTDRLRPSRPELFNKDHNAGCESLSHLRVASPMLGCLYPWGKSQYSFYRRLSGPQDQPGHGGVKKNLHPSGIQDRTRAIQPIAKCLAA